MDIDFKFCKKRKTLLFVISQILAIFAAVLIAIFLILITMGYRFGKEGGLEQTGMLRVNSYPTGAKIAIDYKLISARTNTSQMLSGGNHQVRVSLKNYDSWEKIVKIKPGFLTDLSEVRLFLKKPIKTKIESFSKDTLFSLSPNMKEMLAVTSKNFKFFSFQNEKSYTRVLDNPFGAVPKKIIWSRDQKSFLVEKDDFWHVFDRKTLKVVKLPIEASRLASIDFFSYDGAVVLFAEKANPNKITEYFVEKGAIGEVKNVVSSNLYKNQWLYLEEKGTTKEPINDATKNKVGEKKNEQLAQDEGKKGEEGQKVKKYQLFLKKSDAKEVPIFETDEKITYFYQEAYGEKWLFVAGEKDFVIYKLDFKPFSSELPNLIEVYKKEMKFEIKEIEVSESAKLVAFSDFKDTLVFDFRYEEIMDYKIKGTGYFWVDNFSLVNSLGEEIAICDFDGGNRRVIAKKAKDTPLILTRDNRYLYLIAKEKEELLIYAYAVGK